MMHFIETICRESIYRTLYNQYIYITSLAGIAELPPPKFNSDVIVEDRSQVQRVISSVIRRSFDDPADNEERVTKFVLDRGCSIRSFIFFSVHNKFFSPINNILFNN